MKRWPIRVLSFGLRGLLRPHHKSIAAYLVPHTAALWALAGLTLCYLPLSLIEPYVIMYLIDSMVVEESFAQVVRVFINALGIFVLFSLVEFRIVVVMLRVAARIISRLKEDQLQSLLRKTIEFHNQVRAGRLLYSYFADAAPISAYITVALNNATINVAVLIMRVAVLFWVDVLLAAFFVVTLPILYYIMIRASRAIRHNEARLKELDEELTACIAAGFAHIAQVKSLSLENVLVNQWNRVFGERTKLDYRNLLLQKSASLVVGNAQVLTGLAVLLLGSMQVRSGMLSLGELLGFVAVASRIVPAVNGLIGFMFSSQETRVAVDRYFGVLGAASDVEGVGDGKVRRELTASDVGRVRITAPVVQHSAAVRIQVGVQCDLRPGKVYGWTGPNGSGKTSVALALAGLVSHRPGTILFERSSMGEFDIRSVRRGIRYLGSRPFWPEVPLREVFAGSDPLDESSLAACLRVAGATEIVERLPKKMDEMLPFDGHVLSQGENQRLYVALGLYRRPLILLLDESLSHVDSRTSQRIVRRLRWLGLSVIVISQDQNVLSLCSEVNVFKSP